MEAPFTAQRASLGLQNFLGLSSCSPSCYTGFPLAASSSEPSQETLLQKNRREVAIEAKSILLYIILSFIKAFGGQASFPACIQLLWMFLSIFALSRAFLFKLYIKHRKWHLKKFFHVWLVSKANLLRISQSNVNLFPNYIICYLNI